MFTRRRAPEPVVHSISSVPVSTRDDQGARVRTYLVTMGIRTACFVVAAVVYLTTGSALVAAFFCVGAVVLPYPAVVLANNAGNRQSHFVQVATPVREIGTAEDQLRSPGAGEHW